MFLQVCVCPLGGGGCLPQCMLGCQTPPGPGRHPPGPGRHPPDQADPPGPGTHPPGTRHTHPQIRQTPSPGSKSSIQSTSGRYASYWNAFLLDLAPDPMEESANSHCRVSNIHGIISISWSNCEDDYACSPRFTVMGWQNRLKFSGKTNRLKISLIFTILASFVCFFNFPDRNLIILYQFTWKLPFRVR